MRERPILFSAPMVRAILDGRKTQTRRVVKPAPVSNPTSGPLISFNHGVPEWSFGLQDQNSRGLRWWRCPHGAPGDRLWVREAWQSDVEDGHLKPSEIPKGRPFFYAAGGSKDAGTLAVPCTGYRPSIHMPRWASRIALQITDVRVERLNDISEADALAEGIWQWPDGRFSEHDAPLSANELAATDPVAAYRALWESINGPGAWDANPWVWAITFERVSK